MEAVGSSHGLIAGHVTHVPIDRYHHYKTGSHLSLWRRARAVP